MATTQPVLAHHERVDSAGEAADWLVLLHGMSQDLRVFDRQVEAFRARFRLLLIDLPGHGGSQHLPGPFGPQEFADAVRAVLAHRGVTRAHCFGTHTGAATALLLAATNPGLVRSLVLEGPVFPGEATASVNEVLERVRQVLLRDGIEAARELWWQEGPWFDRMRAAPERFRAVAQRALIADFAGGPWRQAGVASRPVQVTREDLRGLDLPVLIVNGERDVPDFLEAAHALARLLPRCRRISIAGAGGFPLWEMPEEVNARVDEFLAAVRGEHPR